MKVFDKHWFYKYQTPLLWLIRSPLGNLVFRYKRMGHKLNRKLIIRLDPNGVHEFVSYKNGLLIEKLYLFTRNEYARKLYFALLPMWWMMHLWDLIADPVTPQLSFGFSSLTANPQVDGSGTTGNARIRYAPAATTWALITSQGTGSSVAQGNSNGLAFAGGAVSNTWNDLERFYATFDTSSLTSAANISLAVFSVFATGAGNFSDGLGVNPAYNIYTITPAANNSFATSDFGNMGTVKQCDTDLAYNSWNQANNGQNDWSLNATGIGNISKTSITKFGLALVNDRANSAPSWSNASSNVDFYYANNSSSKPQLVITYSTTSIKTIDGLATASVKTIKGLASASVKTWNGLT